MDEFNWNAYWLEWRSKNFFLQLSKMSQNQNDAFFPKN